MFPMKATFENGIDWKALIEENYQLKLEEVEAKYKAKNVFTGHHQFFRILINNYSGINEWSP